MKITPGDVVYVDDDGAIMQIIVTEIMPDKIRGKVHEIGCNAERLTQHLSEILGMIVEFDRKSVVPSRDFKSLNRFAKA